MKVLALVTAGIAVAGLTACTNSTTSATRSSSVVSSQSAASSPTATISIAPAMCRQQYDAWKHGTGKGLIAAFGAVSSAGQAGDIHVLKAVLKRTKPALARAARYPMPTCADPKGYWPVLLMHVNAAASTGSAATIMAALKGVPTLTHELNTELKRTER